MTAPAPDALQALASARDQIEQERAWAAFLDAYSHVILHAARSLGGDHDTVMDRYAFALDALRRDDCRRLRRYLADGRGSFTTWLAVVVRRLCLDEYRHRYGRPQGDGTAAAEQHAGRRNLADLVGSELDYEALTASPADAPDEVLRRRELRAALEAGLAKLDAGDRLLMRLRFEDDLSVPEIARLLDHGSPFRLYRRLNHILASVRRELEAGGIHDATP